MKSYHKRTITAQAPMPKVNSLIRATGGASVEDEMLAFDAHEEQVKNEALNDFFKDCDDDLFQVHEDVSLSTATRDKKTATVPNYATMNQKGLEMTSHNYSSK